MSIEAIKNKIHALSSEERRMLIAYMVALNDNSRADYAQLLAKRLDDKSPGAWLTVEECERELGLSDEAK